MELPVLSPTSLADLDCAKRFHRLRVQRQWPERDPHLKIEYGVAFHAVMRQVCDPRHRPLPNLEHLDAWARTAFFARRYPDADSREREMLRCVRTVRRYAANDEDAEYTQAVEVQGEFPISIGGRPLFLLSGKLDRVIVRPSDRHCLSVRDYKCGQPYRSLEEAFMQLWIAKLSFPGYTSYRLEYDFVDEDGGVEREVVTGADVQGIYAVVMAKARRVFEALTRDEHFAEPGEVCQFCPIRAECRPQQSISVDALEDVFVGEVRATNAAVRPLLTVR